MHNAYYSNVFDKKPHTRKTKTLGTNSDFNYHWNH